VVRIGSYHGESEKRRYTENSLRETPYSVTPW
jgi:hypothetical protein